MPSFRATGLAVVVALGVGLVLELSLHWATFVSVGVGALFGLAALMIGASVDADPEAADAAWKAAAGDLGGGDGAGHRDEGDVRPGERP